MCHSWSSMDSLTHYLLREARCEKGLYEDRESRSRREEVQKMLWKFRGDYLETKPMLGQIKDAEAKACLSETVTEL